MKYCPKLFNEINFEAESLSPCCNTHGLQIPSFPYHGGPVDMAAYARYIQQVAEQLQTDGPICKGCPELRDSRKPVVGELRFDAVSINMHRFFCNCRCVYCSLWDKKDKKPPYEVLTPLQGLYDGGFLSENCVIIWGGGEPTILPEFNKATEWAASKKFYQIVHSNAIRFSEPLAALLRDNLGLVNVSLDSGSPATYAQVKGVDKFRQVSENVERYCAEGSPANVQLKYIIFEPSNKISEIDAFLGFCARLGVKNVQFSFDFRDVNANRLSQKSLLGAAFMRKKGAALGLDIDAFCVDAPVMAKIEALQAQL